MTRFRLPIRVLAPIAAAALLTACVSSPTPAPQAALPAGPAPITGWLAGPVGQQLPPVDLERANAAQVSAAETGRRASWRGTGGNFGFVEPGPEGSGGSASCRSFAHTLYLDGRAQRGTGTACRNPAGAWDVTA